MTFVVWKSYREQSKRITMLVLATDAVTAAVRQHHLFALSVTLFASVRSNGVVEELKTAKWCGVSPVRFHV